MSRPGSRGKDEYMESKEKKTNVIAFKLLPRKTEETQEEEICPVIERIAQRAAERFTHMAINFRMQDTLEMISYLEAAQCGGNGKEVVILMKCIFMAAGMYVMGTLQRTCERI